MALRSRSVLALVAAVAALACGGDEKDDPPSIHATWTWSAPATSCASVAGAVEVEVIATPTGTADVYAVTAPCGAGAASLPLPAGGSYGVVLSLLNATGAALDSTAPQTVSVNGTTHVAGSFDGM